MLEPYDGKLSRTVLRGAGTRKGPWPTRGMENDMKKIKDALKRVTGISTPVGGISWSADDPREQRVERVVDRYLADIIQHTHLVGLLLAGICTLQDDAEIREACRRIADHGRKYPIPKANQPLLETKDLKHFFTLLNAMFQENPGFSSGPVLKAISEAKEKE